MPRHVERRPTLDQMIIDRERRRLDALRRDFARQHVSSQVRAMVDASRWQWWLYDPATGGRIQINGELAATRPPTPNVAIQADVSFSIIAQSSDADVWYHSDTARPSCGYFRARPDSPQFNAADLWPSSTAVPTSGLNLWPFLYAPPSPSGSHSSVSQRWPILPRLSPSPLFAAMAQDNPPNNTNLLLATEVTAKLDTEQITEEAEEASDVLEDDPSIDPFILKGASEVAGDDHEEKLIVDMMKGLGLAYLDD